MFSAKFNTLLKVGTVVQRRTQVQINEYRIYSLLPRFRKLTNKFTASGLQAQASLKSALANFIVCQDLTGEEKQTCELETCTVQATFISKCDRRRVDLVCI